MIGGVAGGRRRPAGSRRPEARTTIGTVSHAPLALTIPLAAVLLLLALPAAITARRGWDGTLDRRGRLGLHTPAAVASERAFALANRVAAPPVAGAAGVGIVCGVLVLALPMGVAGAIVVAVLGLVGLLGQLYMASTMGERAAMTVPLPARKPEPTGSCCGGCGCGDAGCGNAPTPAGDAGTGAPPVAGDADPRRAGSARS